MLGAHSDELLQLRENFETLYAESNTFSYFCFYETLRARFLGFPVFHVSLIRSSGNLAGNLVLLMQHRL
jgi:hypothetical protein